LKCSTRYCRKKTESKGTKFCSVCRKRKGRAADPVKYSYQNLKNRATQRGKPFTITLDFFRAFCRETEYIKGKGRNAKGYTIDCEINELGYVPGNIKILTLEENARKGWKKLEYDWLTRTAFVYSVTGSKIIINDDLPF